jgi:hypothetical protein
MRILFIVLLYKRYMIMIHSLKCKTSHLGMNIHHRNANIITINSRICADQNDLRSELAPDVHHDDQADEHQRRYQHGGGAAVSRQ